MYRWPNRLRRLCLPLHPKCIWKLMLLPQNSRKKAKWCISLRSIIWSLSSVCLTNFRRNCFPLPKMWRNTKMESIKFKPLRFKLKNWGKNWKMSSPKWSKSSKWIKCWMRNWSPNWSSLKIWNHKWRKKRNNWSRNEKICMLSRKRVKLIMRRPKKSWMSVKPQCKILTVSHCKPSRVISSQPP